MQSDTIRADCNKTVDNNQYMGWHCFEIPTDTFETIKSKTNTIHNCQLYCVYARST